MLQILIYEGGRNPDRKSKLVPLAIRLFSPSPFDHPLSARLRIRCREHLFFRTCRFTLCTAWDVSQIRLALDRCPGRRVVRSVRDDTLHFVCLPASFLTRLGNLFLELSSDSISTILRITARIKRAACRITSRSSKSVAEQHCAIVAVSLEHIKLWRRKT